MIANFWRSLLHAPEIVADYADWPMIEADVHARHMWLVSQTEFREKMLTDPYYFDPKIAGWWVWGRSAYIAGGWCDFNAISKTTGRMGRSIPSMGGGRGVLSGRVQDEGVQQHFMRLARRLRHVQVINGDWSRVLTPAAIGPGQVAIVLDPPYFDGLSDGLYAHSDANVSAQVRQWAIENGNNPNYRICLCGYEGEHSMPADWETVSWKASGGYAAGENKQNAERERLWFSPACLKVTDTLFGFGEEEDEDLRSKFVAE